MLAVRRNDLLTDAQEADVTDRQPAFFFSLPPGSIESVLHMVDFTAHYAPVTGFR